MIERLRQRFRQLRWKLTLSYTAVTVGALLIIVFLLASLLLVNILLPYQNITPSGWIDAAREGAAPVFRPLLSQSPIDRELVSATLASVDDLAGTITGRDFWRLESVLFSVRTSTDSDMLLIGPDGSLLGSSNDDFVPQAMLGRPFDASQVPGLTDLLPAALAGERDVQQLFRTIKPDGKSLFAVPIFGAGEDAGRVLGVLVVSAQALPTRIDLLFTTLTLVARSLLVFALIAGIIGAIFGSLTAEGMVSRFKRLWAATDAWSRGDFSRFVHDPSGDEISQLAQRLNSMALQLKELLQTRQQAAISEERNRLARDLHDSAKQDALAASFQLGTAITLLDCDLPAARKHLLEADNLVDSVRLELTDLIHELRPPAMDRRELVQTLSDYAAEWAHQNEIEVELTVPDGDAASPQLGLQVEQAIYRIMQGALANIARHSSAGAARIVLEHEPGGVTLTISDDGAGFDTGRQYIGMGLDSMRERAESLDGNFTIESELGQGTVVSVTLPLPAV